MPRVRDTSLILGSAVALLAAVACHDYALFDYHGTPDGAEPPLAGASGTNPDLGGNGPAGNAAGGQDALAGARGVEGGAENGGAGGGNASGEGGTAGAGGHDAGHDPTGGESGAGGQGDIDPDGPPSVLGTVFIQTATKACAGTLQTNAWVLTAGHCIPKDVEPVGVTVMLGSDREHPRDVVRVSEIVRFGEPEEARDLALLRLARPFSVGGSTSGYVQPFYPAAIDPDWDIRLYCLGWDMSPSEGMATTTQSGLLKLGDVELGTVPQVGDGMTLWLMNNAWEAPPETGRITQAADEGGGCFIEIEATGKWYQVAVQLDNPALDRGGQPNPNLWGRAASLTDSATRHWMVRSMLGQTKVSGITPSRGVGAMLELDGQITVLWIDADGNLLRAPLKDPSSAENLSKPAGVSFVSQRPGATALADETLVVAYGDDQKLWYRRLGPSPADWAVVESAVSPTSPASVVNVDGVAHLYALGAATDIRQAKFEGGAWQQWNTLGGGCKGAPSAFYKAGTNIVVRSPNDYVWQTYSTSSGSPWNWVQTGTFSTADPLVIQSEWFQLDFFARDSSGNLRVRWYNGYWLSEWLDPGVPTGEYMTVVTKTDGSYDLLTSDGVELTHFRWPR